MRQELGEGREQVERRGDGWLDLTIHHQVPSKTEKESEGC